MKRIEQSLVEPAPEAEWEVWYVTHANLILANLPGEQILTAAEAASDRQDFEARLSDLTTH